MFVNINLRILIGNGDLKMHFTVFDQNGKENTTPTLEIAKENADELGIKTIVIASTWGNTISEAIQIFDPSQYNLVCVMHNYGFNDQEEQEFPEDFQKDLKLKGVNLVVGTLAFSGVGSALMRKYQYFDSITLFTRLVRTLFADGVKVAMEIVLMAVDGGAVRAK